MRNIAELTVLLRERVALPDDLKLVTEEFREGLEPCTVRRCALAGQADPNARMAFHPDC